MLVHTTKSIQREFCKAPEAPNAVDMHSASDELILPVINAQLPSITDVDQAVVAPPPIRVDDAIQGNTTSDNPLQRRLSAVRDDCCVNTTVAFEYAEVRSSTEVATSSPAFNAPGTEVRLIHFDLTRERRPGHAIFSNVFTATSQITVDRIVAQPGHSGDPGSIGSGTNSLMICRN